MSAKEKTAKKKVSGWLVFIGIVLAMGVVRVITTPRYDVSPEASKNTFVNACVSGGSESIRDFCGCAYEQMLIMYPDFANNDEVLNRINSAGYNQQETDAIISSCGSLIDAGETT